MSLGYAQCAAACLLNTPLHSVKHNVCGGLLPELRNTEGAEAKLTRVVSGLESFFLHVGVYHLS